MLNAHDEYLLEGVTVERLDEGESFELAEIAVPRDEIYLVHANEPRGDAARRNHTTPHHLAIKMGPYQVRGFFHSLPGADPVEALRRRMAMVPLTDARIEYLFHGETRATRVDVVIVNREQIDWVRKSRPARSSSRPTPSTWRRSPPDPSRRGLGGTFGPSADQDPAGRSGAVGHRQSPTGTNGRWWWTTRGRPWTT